MLSKIGKIVERIFIMSIELYRTAVSPWMGRACRYEPSCSVYVSEAIRQYGPGRGLWLGAKRILKCHPFSGYGYDPVPNPLDVKS